MLKSTHAPESLSSGVPRIHLIIIDAVCRVEISWLYKMLTFTLGDICHGAAKNAIFGQIEGVMNAKCVSTKSGTIVAAYCCE